MATRTKKKSKSKKRNGDDFLEALTEVLDKKAKADAEMIRYLKKLGRRAMRNVSRTNGPRKTYVQRLDNRQTLIKAIKSCMVPNEEMTMREILSLIAKKGAYNTNSTYFYAMVNNKLNRDKEIKKVGRGVFTLKTSKKKPSTKKRKRLAA
jgi:hypothetical protein